MTEQRPSSKTVPLQDGRLITIGRMKWQGYVRLKNRVVELLSDQVGAILAGFLTQSGDGTAWTSDATLQALPRLLQMVNQAVNDATPELIDACVPEPLDKTALELRDWFDLRDACAEVNDLGDLIEREKNSLRATFGTAMNLMTRSSADRSPGSTGTSPTPSPANSGG
jgi:hypothetical protein